MGREALSVEPLVVCIAAVIAFLNVEYSELGVSPWCIFQNTTENVVGNTDVSNELSTYVVTEV